MYTEKSAVNFGATSVVKKKLVKKLEEISVLTKHDIILKISHDYRYSRRYIFFNKQVVEWCLHDSLFRAKIYFKFLFTF